MKTLYKTLPLIVGFIISGLIVSLFGLFDLDMTIGLCLGAYVANLTHE